MGALKGRRRHHGSVSGAFSGVSASRLPRESLPNAHQLHRWHYAPWPAFWRRRRSIHNRSLCLVVPSSPESLVSSNMWDYLETTMLGTPLAASPERR